MCAGAGNKDGPPFNAVRRTLSMICLVIAEDAGQTRSVWGHVLTPVAARRAVEILKKERAYEKGSQVSRDRRKGRALTA